MIVWYNIPMSIYRCFVLTEFSESCEVSEC